MANSELNQFNLRIDEKALLEHDLIAVSAVHDARMLKDIDITDVELAALARRAYIQMQSLWRRLQQNVPGPIPKKVRSRLNVPPAAISLMIANQRLFVCSSVRGSRNPFFSALPQTRREATALQQLMQQCNLMDSEGEVLHQYNANCAEVHVLHYWKMMHPGLKWEDLKGVSIATAGRDRQNKEVVLIKTPCVVETLEGEAQNGAVGGCLDIIANLCMLGASTHAFQDEYFRGSSEGRVAQLLGGLNALRIQWSIFM
jgi:hypothetical protein